MLLFFEVFYCGFEGSRYGLSGGIYAGEYLDFVLGVAEGFMAFPQKLNALLIVLEGFAESELLFFKLANDVFEPR